MEPLEFHSRHPTNAWLSNFAAPADGRFVDDRDGLWWPTVEHYYQASKTDDLE